MLESFFFHNSANFYKAPSIGVLGKFLPKVSSEIVLASQVNTFPLYPFKKGTNSEAGLELLIIIAPSSFNPFVTSTLSIRVHQQQQQNQAHKY